MVLLGMWRIHGLHSYRLVENIQLTFTSPSRKYMAYIPIGQSEIQVFFSSSLLFGPHSILKITFCFLSFPLFCLIFGFVNLPFSLYSFSYLSMYTPVRRQGIMTLHNSLSFVADIIVCFLLPPNTPSSKIHLHTSTKYVVI